MEVQIVKDDVTYTIAPVETRPRVRDHFPMLFYNNDTVVEIKMVEAIFQGNTWEFVERGTVLENPGKTITKVVFEGPEGCYETHVVVAPKGELRIMEGDGDGSPWYPCQ